MRRKFSPTNYDRYMTVSIFLVNGCDWLKSGCVQSDNFIVVGHEP